MGFGSNWPGFNFWHFLADKRLHPYALVFSSLKWVWQLFISHETIVKVSYCENEII